MRIIFRSVLTGLKVDAAALLNVETNGNVKSIIVTMKGNQDSRTQQNNKMQFHLNFVAHFQVFYTVLGCCWKSFPISLKHV